MKSKTNWLWVRRASQNGGAPGHWERLGSVGQGKWSEKLVKWAFEHFPVSRQGWEDACREKGCELDYEDWAFCGIAGSINGHDWKMDWVAGDCHGPYSEPEDERQRVWVPDGSDFAIAFHRFLTQGK